MGLRRKDAAKLDPIQGPMFVGPDAPVTPVEGTGWYDTGASANKLWVNGAWVTLAGGGGMSDLIDDLTPQLGGNLDANGKTIDGRTVATDGTKLDGIESAADVTDATNVNAAGAVMNADIDAKGDVFVGTADNALVRLAVGTNNQVLTAASGEASGVKWAAGGGGSSVSTIFVTDVGSSGGSSISDENWESGTDPANKVLVDADSDGDAVVISIEVDAGPTGAIGQGWQPTVTVRGADASVTVTNLAQIDNSRRFTGSAVVAIATPGDYTIYADAVDTGQSQNVTVTRLSDPPEINTLVFDNQGSNADPYPAIQTQVKQNDTVKISGQTDRTDGPFDIYVIDSDLTNGQGVQGPFVTNASGAFSSATDAGLGTIAVGSGTDATSFLTARAKVTGGSFGGNKVSATSLDKDQTSPSIEAFSQADCTYPATQEALKDVETVDVHITHDNIAAGDTYLYDNNSTGELTIPATTTYGATKTLTRLAGNYRESGTNYRLTVTRTEKNGASSTRNMTVKIAHVSPVVTITGATSRLRTDDGTDSYKDSTITIESSQANLSTYTASVSLALDAGHSTPPVFQGSWSASGNTDYTRSLRVADGTFESGGTASNTWTWGACSVKNRAGKEATTVTTNTAYNLGGFEKRRLTIPAWVNREADIGCLVVDTSKLTAEALSKGGGGPGGGTIQTFDSSPGQGSTPDDEVDKFCISDGGDLVDDDGQFYYNKDQPNAESNTSGTAQVDIEETA